MQDHVPVRVRACAARLLVLVGLVSVACLGGACGGGGGATPSLDGAWTSPDFFGHATVLFLCERADGRVVGYLPADPSLLLVGGGRSGNAVDLDFTQEDPGLTASGSFAGTLAPDGASFTGLYDDGSGPVAMSFTRTSAPLTIEHWLLVDFSQDQVVRASRVRDGADAFTTGGFVGLRGCGFLACAGDWASWSITGDDHAISATSEGACPPATALMGTWSATDRFMNGTYTTTDCTGGTLSGSWGAGRVGFTTSAHVKAALRTVVALLDALESESIDFADALTPTYLHDGRTKADVQADMAALFAAFDDLDARATVREVISANSGEEFPDVAAPPRLEWRLDVTGVPAGGGARASVVDLDTAVLDQEDLRWIAVAADEMNFVGSGFATPFEIEMPIQLADSTNAHYGIWPWGVHGGGHPEGHPGWDVEYVDGGKVLAVADGTVASIRAKEAPYLGQWEVTVAHRPGRSTRYDHLEALEPGITEGAAVVTGQPLADAGQVGTIFLTHFAVVASIEAVCPEPFLSATARILFDTIWAGASYNEELCEPRVCNPTDVAFPLTCSWFLDAGALPPRIDFTRPDPNLNDYRYTLRSAAGVALEAGTVVLNTQAAPHATIDLVPDGGGATHLGVYDIVSERLWIDWDDVVRPASLVGASQYTLP